MQGIAIKYIINILLGIHHSQESRGRSGKNAHENVNLFLVLHLR